MKRMRNFARPFANVSQYFLARIVAILYQEYRWFTLPLDYCKYWNFEKYRKFCRTRSISITTIGADIEYCDPDRMMTKLSEKESPCMTCAGETCQEVFSPDSAS